MPGSARLCLFSGFLVLGLAVFNALSADAFSPSLQRAEVLAGMAGVGLMLVAVLWTRALPLSPEAVNLEGEQGLLIAEGLTNELRTELAWGALLMTLVCFKMRNLMPSCQACLRSWCNLWVNGAGSCWVAGRSVASPVQMSAGCRVGLNDSELNWSGLFATIR